MLRRCLRLLISNETWELITSQPSQGRGCKGCFKVRQFLVYNCRSCTPRPSKYASIGNHTQRVSDTCTFFVCLVNLKKKQSGFESVIKNKTNAKLRRLNVSQLMLHRHLFSSRRTPTFQHFQPNTKKTHTQLD